MKDYKFIVHDDATPQIFQNARSLRKNMTPAEQHLWQALRRKQLNGYKFRRQHPIKKFVLDFYCHEAKLGIELDGAYHQEPAQKLYDEDRTKLLETLGIKIVRFPNRAVFDNLGGLLQEISKVAIERADQT